MKVKLVFQDWQKPVGTSIYSTEEGCELSMGCLHSGTTFDATIDFDEDSAIDLRQAFRSGATPVFYVVCEHKPSTQWEWCDCEDMLQDIPCGCGEDNARLYRDSVIHWRGGHWRVECAFAEAMKSTDVDKNAGE